MNKCSVCENKTFLYSHRDIKLCFYCATKRGWRGCRHCGLLHHPDDIHNIDGMTVCTSCWDEGKSNCDLCASCCPSWFMVSGCEHEDDVVMCLSCSRKTTFDRKTSYVCNNYLEVPSDRYFGIELETHRCVNYRQLLEGNCWGAKYDDTVEGMEFDSPKFKGDCGFEAVASICNIAKDNAWQVNSDCGFHLHLDMSNESAKNLRAIAYAYDSTIEVWRELVSDDRQLSSWCTHENDSSEIQYLTSKTAWKSYAGSHARRHVWLNWSAYYDYGTIEIRSHEGTLDPEAICNWVKAHMVFVDWATKVGEKTVLDTLRGTKSKLFSIIADIWSEAGQSELHKYYSRKSIRLLEESLI